MADTLVECRYCRYYYITYDKHFPYGCRAFGFKSKVKPCIDVRASSGEECLNFMEK